MKKLLIYLLLISSFIKTAYAETYEGNATISLSYSVSPSYTVKLPKKVNITNNTTCFKYSVSGDIYADQTLKILFDKQATIYCGNSNHKVNVVQEKSEWSYSQLTNSLIEYEVTITHTDLASGNWHGNLNVVISLIGGN